LGGDQEGTKVEGWFKRPATTSEFSPMITEKALIKFDGIHTVRGVAGEAGPYFRNAQKVLSENKPT
jgi:hypothetical protein